MNVEFTKAVGAKWELTVEVDKLWQSRGGVGEHPLGSGIGVKPNRAVEGVASKVTEERAREKGEARDGRWWLEGRGMGDRGGLKKSGWEGGAQIADSGMGTQEASPLEGVRSKPMDWEGERKGERREVGQRQKRRKGEG
ncbi:hypothetical protein AMTR_s00048p00207360 [Amborella trichopoda]|uniref:Uncharacterized protein n=1 Tax=Amborella trichopoda TaxID=13333 RepID=U5D2N3_AMBTC|nr:hypothetical protein AMTR_s00048p00207360 [Amborella trichopoda]